MAGPTDPRHSGRFKKGRTGNPNGRPRKVRPAEASAFQILVDRTLTVTQNGVPREMTVDEALQQRTLEAAIAGSRMAERTILKMITKREKARAAKFGGPRTQLHCALSRKTPRMPMRHCKSSVLQSARSSGSRVEERPRLPTSRAMGGPGRS